MPTQRDVAAKARKRLAPKDGQRLLGVHVARKTSTALHPRQSDRTSGDDDGVDAPPSFIDEIATARQLGLAVKTLQNWRVQGKGPPFFLFGRRVLYSPAENARWAQARRVQSTSDLSAREPVAS